jgi:hypothetical protein
MGEHQRFFLKLDRKFVQKFDFFVQKMKKRRDKTKIRTSLYRNFQA